MTDAALSSRLQSFTQASVLCSEQLEQLGMLPWPEGTAALSSGLYPLYKEHVQRLWGESVECSDSPGTFATRERIVSVQLSKALVQEVELFCLYGAIDEQDRRRLNDVLTDENRNGVYRMFLRAPNVDSLGLLSVFMVTADPNARPQTDDSPVFLLSADRGVEKFANLSVLNQSLVERIHNPTQLQGLLAAMSLSDRAIFEASEPNADWNPAHYFIAEALSDWIAVAIRTRQLMDFEFLLGKAEQEQLSGTAFLQRVRQSRPLDEFIKGMQGRFMSLLSLIERRTRPAWLREADAFKQQHYDELKSQHLERQDALNRLMNGVESIEQFASSKIEEYLVERLEYSIDPRQVNISIESQIPVGNEDFIPLYEGSLLDFAIKGLPHASAGKSIAVPTGYPEKGLSFELIETMIQTLDVVPWFARELQRRYLDHNTQAAFVHLLSSAIDLSVWGGAIRGELSDAGQELVSLVSGDKPKEGSRLSVGGLSLLGTQFRFKDVVVFCEEQAENERYVLYAPGAPQGRDTFEFDSWKKLWQEVAGWLSTPQGEAYLMNQVSIKPDDARHAFISATKRFRNNWNDASLIFVRGTHATYSDNLSVLVLHKTQQFLTDEKVVVAANYGPNDSALRREKATYVALIAALEEEYVKVTREIKSYRAFVHGKASWVLKGLPAYAQVDPDTVYFDLQGNTVNSHPYFGPYTSLVKLTDLFVSGYSSRYAFHTDALVYSSVGEDLSKLSLTYIDQQLRKSRLGEDYIKVLKNKLVNPSNRYAARRRSCLAARTACSLLRDVIEDHLAGGLSESQRVWLKHLVHSLIAEFRQSPARQQLEATLLKDSRVSVLHINDCEISGVFVFKDFGSADPQYTLIYTPQAPDGRIFRRADEFEETLKNTGMIEYYYGRARYKKQPKLGTLFESLNRVDPSQRQSIDISVRPEYQFIDLEPLFEKMIKGMIEDVDAQTETDLERSLELGYRIVSWTGTILLLPYPPAALAWGVMNMSISWVRGVIAYVEGDRSEAGYHFGSAFIGAIFGGLGLKTVAEEGAGLAWRAIRWSYRTVSTSGSAHLRAFIHSAPGTGRNVFV